MNTSVESPLVSTARSPRVVVGGVRHLTSAIAGVAVARSVWVGAIVEALEVLAFIPVVARVAHAPRNGELHRTPSVEGTVVLAVLRGGSRAEFCTWKARGGGCQLGRISMSY